MSEKISLIESDQILSRLEIIQKYNSMIETMEERAIADNQRAYGGFIRSEKGKLLEYTVRQLIRIAWHELGQEQNRLSIHKVKTYKIQVKTEYVQQLQNLEVKSYILDNIEKYLYRAKVDVHVFVDEKFVLGIECKAYTENAMLKRILIDFMLLKQMHPNLNCCLIQLESQLGGDYSSPKSLVQYGSPSTHTLMSFFENVHLHIITILEGERNIKKPIHKKEYIKKLDNDLLNQAIKKLKQLLKDNVRG